MNPNKYSFHLLVYVRLFLHSLQSLTQLSSIKCVKMFLKSVTVRIICYISLEACTKSWHQCFLCLLVKIKCSRHCSLFSSVHALIQSVTSNSWIKVNNCILNQPRLRSAFKSENYLLPETLLIKIIQGYKKFREYITYKDIFVCSQSEVITWKLKTKQKRNKQKQQEFRG